MKGLLSEAFERYGMTAFVTHGEETAETKAFVQPMKRESGGEPFSVAPLGAVSEQCWRYLGPAEATVAMGDRVRCGGRNYMVRAAAPFRAGGEVVYYHAVLREEEEP